MNMKDAGVNHSPIVAPKGVSFVYLYLEKGVGTPRVADLIAGVNAKLAELWNTGNSALTDPVKAIEYGAHGNWAGAAISLNKSSRYLNIVACEEVTRQCLAIIVVTAPSFGLTVKTMSNQHGPYMVLARR
jgi:hypothetical protein